MSGDIVERLEYLVSLNTPKSPYQGYAAAQCVEAMASAADEITRLRAAGDALADAANDDLPSLWTIGTIATWQEARRER